MLKSLTRIYGISPVIMLLTCLRLIVAGRSNGAVIITINPKQPRSLSNHHRDRRARGHMGHRVQGRMLLVGMLKLVCVWFVGEQV